MNYIEAIITTSTEGAEIVLGILDKFCISEVIVEDRKDFDNILTNQTNWDYIDEDFEKTLTDEVKVKFYISQNDEEKIYLLKQDICEILKIDFGFDLGSMQIAQKIVDDKDWIDKWKDSYKTFSIGDKIVIKPIWEQNLEQNKIVFNIDPGNAFGTGLHQTTQLCLLELEKNVNQNTVLLDLGCGTGILSIICLLLGAKNAYAVDIDINASNTAKKNAKLNNIDDTKYKVFSGDILKDQQLLESISKIKYNIVVSNIVADIILNLIPIVYQILDKDGIFICSGIIEKRCDEVIYMLEQHGFSNINSRQKDGWILLIANKVI